MTTFDHVNDSGERRSFDTGSVRDVRTGKGRYDLIPPLAIKRIAQHFENGAVKYGDKNWELGQPLSSYLDSGLRHTFNLLELKTDEDHASAGIWNLIAFLCTADWILEGKLPRELDDIGYCDALEEERENKMLENGDGVIPTADMAEPEDFRRDPWTGQRNLISDTGGPTTAPVEQGDDGWVSWTDGDVLWSAPVGTHVDGVELGPEWIDVGHTIDEGLTWGYRAQPISEDTMRLLHGEPVAQWRDPVKPTLVNKEDALAHFMIDKLGVATELNPPRLNVVPNPSMERRYVITPVENPDQVRDALRRAQQEALDRDQGREPSCDCDDPLC